MLPEVDDTAVLINAALRGHHHRLSTPGGAAGSPHQPGQCPDPGTCDPMTWPAGFIAWMSWHQRPPAGAPVADAERPDYDGADEGFNDAHLAAQIARDVLAGRFRWVPDIGWRTVHDGQWVPCSTEVVLEQVRRYLLAQWRPAHDTARANRDDTAAQELEEQWRRTLAKGRIAALVDLAKGVPGVLDTTAVPMPLPVDVATLAERLTRPEGGAAYRIDGWQPFGSRVLLAAQYKAGKTTAVGNLVRSLVDGDDWLGRHKVEPVDGTVVVLDLEMSAGQLDGWLRDQSIKATGRVVPIPLRGNVGALNLLDGATRAQWATRLRDLQCRYLVLDCLRPVLDALGLDESRDAGRFLVALDALLAQAGVLEATVVHHMGHNGERSRGDSRLRDWPDVEWRLIRQDDNPGSARYLTAYGRDVDQRETRLDYDPATRRLTTAGGSRAEFATSTTLAAVIDTLKIKSRQSVRDLQAIADTTDHTRDGIRDAIKVGVRAGQIITEKGPHNSILHSLADVSSLLGGTDDAD